MDSVTNGPRWEKKVGEDLHTLLKGHENLSWYAVFRRSLIFHVFANVYILRQMNTVLRSCRAEMYFTIGALV